MDESIDHDRLFKLLLTTFFVEFIEMFLPEVAAYLDRGTIEFLDKELFTDLTSGERHEVDLVARARFRDQEAFFLIHIENQASAQDMFASRMFRYFSRLHERHGLPVYPIALLSYDAPLRAEPDRYTVAFPDCVVMDFKFKVVQLNRLNWREYVRRPNPVASALMTKMRIAPADRPRVKLECLRMLATLKLNAAKAALIATFMKTYLKLSAEEFGVYNRELAEIPAEEREVVMQLTNEWMDLGLEKGLGQLRQVVTSQLRRRFGPLPAALEERVRQLPSPELTEFGEVLLDFQDVSSAQAWLDLHR